MNTLIMEIIELEKIPQKELIPGYNVRFVHSENVTIAYWEIKAGRKLPEHSHVHEQISHAISGDFELTVDEKVIRLKPGQIVIIPSNAKHSGLAITDCKMTDVFYPVREDYK